MSDETRDVVRTELAHALAKLGVKPQDPDDVEGARVKVRGDYYADCAVGSMIKAQQEPDAMRASNDLRVAQVYASLCLRDSIQEATATLKEIAGQETAATGELSSTLKKATNVVVDELRKATVKAA